MNQTLFFLNFLVLMIFSIYTADLKNQISEQKIEIIKCNKQVEIYYNDIRKLSR